MSEAKKCPRCKADEVAPSPNDVRLFRCGSKLYNGGDTFSESHSCAILQLVAMKEQLGSFNKTAIEATRKFLAQNKLTEKLIENDNQQAEEITRLREALDEIAKLSDLLQPFDPNAPICDDQEVCLDLIHDSAQAALAKCEVTP